MEDLSAKYFFLETNLAISRVEFKETLANFSKSSSLDKEIGFSNMLPAEWNKPSKGNQSSGSDSINFFKLLGLDKSTS